MTREEKTVIIEELKQKFAETPYFYIVDASGFSVAQDNDLRRTCFNADIEYRVVKNTLIKKALEALDADYSPFVSEKVLKGYSGIMFSKEVGNKPARLIKDFRKKNNTEKPLLKGASIDKDLFIGDTQLDTLANLKSKLELLGDIIGALQAPAQNVIAALQGQGSIIAGILQTLEEKKS
jgi:large subunit ribosomal protein L10